MPTPVPDADPAVIRRVVRILRPLQLYHRHQVRGMEHIPRSGPALLVVHHSLATYDGFMLGLSIFEQTGRPPRGLGDDLIFRTPMLGRGARAIGIVPASPTAGEDLLRAGELVGVAPGGMWEGLRPRSERYQTRWEGRRGFIRLALRCGAPLVLAACPRADDLYTVYGSRLTDAVYAQLKAPLPLLRGLGPTLIPRPVQLTHTIAPPIQPPPYEPDREDEQVEALFAEAEGTMRALLRLRG
jgi:1-acyl-sn-glycerol-3-phosphate acyltransferase